MATAGCGGDSGTQNPGPSASEQAREARITSAGVDCLSEENKKKLVLYSQDGIGYAAGTGDTAVVLLHQADGGLCQWTAYADYLAGKGMRGFSIDISSVERADEAVKAVAWLREQGAKKVFIVGASMGGSTALAAAARTPVDGVVSLSGPSAYAGADAIAAMKSLTMPVLIAAGENEGTFTDSARELFAACTSKQKRLVLLPTSNHGVALMSMGMEDIVDAFVADPAATVAAS